MFWIRLMEGDITHRGKLDSYDCSSPKFCDKLTNLRVYDRNTSNYK